MLQPPNPKWNKDDFSKPFRNWKQPASPYPTSEIEAQALFELEQTFEPLPIYRDMEAKAIVATRTVEVPIPLPDGYIAFLENTSERCMSPRTKHSRRGRRSAAAWVQRVDTPENAFRRLTDGYGISLMFGERCHQYIRNSNNWRGASGSLLDIDDWRTPVAPGSLEEKIERRLRAKGTPAELKERIKAAPAFRGELVKELQAHIDVEQKYISSAVNNFLKPLPCYAMQELFDRYPLLKSICSFLIPSASSLYNSKPFKARGVVLFPEPITDQRVYRAFGDILLSQLDCIPTNVTKNSAAVGFGNTHNASQAYQNDMPDTDWIAEALERATSEVHRTRQEKQDRKSKSIHHKFSDNRKDKDIEDVLSYISPDCGYDEWLQVGMGLKDGGYPFHVWDSWSARGSTYNQSEMQSKWDSFKRTGIGIGTVFHIAKSYGYQHQRVSIGTPRPPKPTRFAKANDTSKAPREKSDTIRKNLSEAMKQRLDVITNTDNNKKQVVFGNASTGAGKSYLTIEIIAHSDETAGICITGNAEQRDQTYEDAKKLFGGEDRVFSWKGRMTGFHLSDDMPLEDRQLNESLFKKGVLCPVADWHKELTSKGVRSTDVCDMCPLRLACLDQGHLSQWDAVKDRKFVTIALPDALDEGFADFLKILSEKMDQQKTLVIRDDYTLQSLLNDVEVRIDDLKIAAENKKAIWTIDTNGVSDETLEDIEFVRYAHGFLERLVEILTGEAHEVFSKVKTLVDDCVAAGIAEATTTGLSLVVHNGEVKTAADAYADRMKLKDMGRVWVGNGNVFNQLRRWTTQNDADSVIYKVVAQTLQFRLKSTLTGIDNLMLLSGTTPVHLAKKLLPAEKCEFHEITMPQPALAKDVQILQYGDAKLTSESVFEVDDSRTAIKIKPYASERIFQLCQKVNAEKANRNSSGRSSKALLVSFSEFCTDKTGNPLNPAIYHAPEAEVLRETFDWILHYRTAEGRNLEGLGVNVLFGYPKVRHEDVQTMTSDIYAKRIPKDYTEATEVRETTRGGIRLTERCYIDDDAEAVRIAIGEGLINQAVGRSRPFTWMDTKTLIYTKCVTDVSTHATIFGRADFTNSGALADIPAVVDLREKAVASGDVQAVMEATGKSRRTAERETKPIRDQLNAERDEKVIALWDGGKGLNKSEIHRKTGIPRTTILDILRRVSEGDEKRQTQLIPLNYIKTDAIRHPSGPPVDADVPTETPAEDFTETLQIGTLFFGKTELTASQIAKLTGRDENRVSEILTDWYRAVCLSPGVGDAYWQSPHTFKNWLKKYVAPATKEYIKTCGTLVTVGGFPDPVEPVGGEYAKLFTETIRQTATEGLI